MQYLFRGQQENIFKKNKEMLHWIDHIYIHRNRYEGEKDYGVPMNKIIDSNRKIK